MTEPADDAAFRARLLQEIRSLVDDAQALVNQGTDPLDAACRALVSGSPRRAVAFSVVGVAMALTPPPNAVRPPVN